MNNKKDNVIYESKLIEFLNEEYPFKKAEKWDFPGYALKSSSNNKINKILICLDVNKFSVEKSIQENVNMIISFHPFKFGKTWNEIYSYDWTKKELVSILKKNKISVFSLHTNFDQDENGTKYHFINALGLLKNVECFTKYAAIVNKNILLNDLVSLIKEKLNINYVLTNIQDNVELNSIYFCPGAGDVYEFINIKGYENIDCLVTSDIKWNEQQVLNSIGVKFIIIPHKCEDVFVDAMSNKINEEFGDKLEIIKYKNDDFIRGL